MSFVMMISNYMIPALFFYVIGLGLVMKKNVYEDFIRGARNGFMVVLDILPTLIGLMVAIGMIRASGALSMAAGVLTPFMERLHFPAELVPLVVIKMFSSSAATSLLLDILGEYGPDSMLGRLASIIMSCTETIFYTMAVYFMAAGVKKTRYTFAGAITATLTGVIVSTVLVQFF